MAADGLALLERTSDPGLAAKLTRAQLVLMLRAARRHHVETKAATLMATLRRPTLRQSSILEGAYAAIVVTEVKVIRALNEQISALGTVVGEHFGRHPTAEIYLSQPGLGTVLAARTLGEFGDDTGRFSDARGLRMTSPFGPTVLPLEFQRTTQQWVTNSSTVAVPGRRLGPPPEGLAWPVVEFVLDMREVFSGVHGQVRPFGEVVAQQSVFSLVPRCHGECGSQK